MDGDATRKDPLSVAADQPQVEEGWIALCEQAAVEQDPKRLLELVKEINRLLDARRQGLGHEVVKEPVPSKQP